MPKFLNIKDKVEIQGKDNKKMFCPPHTFPHKLPFTKPITKEPCHYHKRKWRMFHHRIFCYLFCPHYKKMMKNYRKIKK